MTREIHPPDAALREHMARLRAEQERLFADLKSGESRFRHLARSVSRVEEDERRRISRDLHDGVGQVLSALRLRVEAAREAVGEGDAARELDQALRLCEQALDETRSLARLLRPQILDDLGLEAAVRWLVRNSAEACGCEVELNIALGPATVPAELGTVAFRLLQEALTNIARHAHASHIAVRLARRGEELQLLVADNGRSFDVEAQRAAASAGRGSGLAGMRERVSLLGGRLSIRSEPGEGTQVRVSLPLDAGATT